MSQPRAYAWSQTDNFHVVWRQPGNGWLVVTIVVLLKWRFSKRRQKVCNQFSFDGKIFPSTVLFWCHDTSIDKRQPPHKIITSEQSLPLCKVLNTWIQWRSLLRLFSLSLVLLPPVPLSLLFRHHQELRLASLAPTMHSRDRFPSWSPPKRKKHPMPKPMSTSFMQMHACLGQTFAGTYGQRFLLLF